MEKIHNLKWERLQNLFDTISWFLVKSPVFLPGISWFSKFWSGMSAKGINLIEIWIKIQTIFYKKNMDQ